MKITISPTPPAVTRLCDLPIGQFATLDLDPQMCYYRVDEKNWVSFEGTRILVENLNYDNSRITISTGPITITP